MFEIGFTYRHEYYDSIVAHADQIDYLEIIPDGLDLGDGSANSARIKDLRRRLPFSAHSIELSVASWNDEEFLVRLEAIVAFLIELEVTHYSDHLAYTRAGAYNCDAYIPPLFGIEPVDNVASRCAAIIRRLSEIGAAFSLENVANTAMADPLAIGLEGAFMRELSDRTGIGYILNIDSLLISASALGIPPQQLLATYPVNRIETVTIVPADAMNVVMNQQYGILVEREALNVFEEALNLINPSRVVIQVRYPHNTLDTQLPYIDRLKSIRAKLESGLANGSPLNQEKFHAAE
ncbi:MAG TPA: DUF692 family multinuclear iron-containing protein [Devosia sp.]|jgi:uncharacterized protein (UPF0276 family)|uniref:multinuclear nonheme iron-dependent oxidase n=1 Tax=Devosia sp. TaxID=1871048 RepID=UPI002F936D3A